MTCSTRFKPHTIVPGRRADSYICHFCGEEEDRYQLREDRKGVAKRVDCSNEFCRKCLEKMHVPDDV